MMNLRELLEMLLVVSWIGGILALMGFTYDDGHGTGGRFSDPARKIGGDNDGD